VFFVALCLEARESIDDDLFGLGGVTPTFDVDKFLGLEVLVASEEVLDLLARLLGNICDVLNVSPARVLMRHDDDLGIGASFVAHVENAHGANLHANAGKDGVFEKNQGVYGVAVKAQSVLEVPIIGGVSERREEHAVQINATGEVVNFVLVAASFRDFNNDVICGHEKTPSNC
jgi:hypothetical protein